MGRRTEFLQFSPPSITEHEIDEVVDTLRGDWISTGPKVNRFETAFAAAVDAPAALALSSCTGGLHVAIAALGIGRGHAVLVPTMTFCATANVVEHEGATPILVDVQPDTLNLDPKALEEALASIPDGLTPKAVMPVHHSGHPCDMAPILGLAAEHRLAVIEDAAHALPAAVDGRPVGSVGPVEGDVPRAVAFSFYATKNLTTGEGGMLTGSAELVDEARLWALHGMSRDAWNRYGEGGSWRYDVVRPGFKYNMADTQAALGIHQLERLPASHARRVAVVERYRAGLGDLDAVALPVERPTVQHGWHLFVVQLDLDVLAIDRDRFIDELAERNIGASVHFIPLHLHTFYRERYGLRPDDLPAATAAFERIVSLPLNTRMSDDDVDDVIDAVRDIVATHRR